MFEVVSHDGARHHFSKRFSEFEAMRKQSLKYGKLPLLPPKGGLFGKVGMNQTRVHKRYVALGKWLAACLEHMQTSSDDPGGRSSELCELFFDYVSANQAPTPSVRARQIFYHEENVPPENGSAAAKRVVSVAEESKRRGPVRGHGLSDAERRLQNRARGNSKGGGGGGGKRGGKRGRGGSSGDGDGDGEYDEEYDEEVEGEDEDDDSGFERAETKTTRGTPPPADLLSPLKSPATEIERKREAPLPLDPVAFEAWKVKVRAWKNDLQVRVSEDREEMVSRLQLQVKQWRATMRKRATSAIEGYQAKAAEESQKRQHLQKKMEIAKVRYSDMQRRLSDVESEGFNATVITAATAATAAAAASKGGGPTLEVAVRAAHTQKDRADRAIKELQQARREVAALRGRVKELEGGGAQLLKERNHLKEEVAFLRQRGTVRNTPPSSSFLSPSSSSASSSNSSSSSSTVSRPIPLKTSPATTKPTKHRLSPGRRREAKGEPEDGNDSGGGGVDEGEGGSGGRGVSDGRPPRANSTSGVPTKNRSLRFSRHNVASRRAVSASVGSAAARNVMRSNSADEGTRGGVVDNGAEDRDSDNGAGVGSKPSAHQRNKSHSGLRGELEREEDLGAAAFGVEEKAEAEVAAETGTGAPQTRTREKEDEEGEGEEENLPVSGWIEAKAEDGRTYYYHKQTRRVRWEKPEGEVAGRIEKRLHDEKVEAERRQKEKVKRLRKRREEQEALDAATRGLTGVESTVNAWAKGKRLPYLLANLCTILEELAASPAGAGSPPLNSSDKTLLLPPAMVRKCQDLHAGSEYATVHTVYIRVLRLLHPDKLALAPQKSRLTAQKLFMVLTAAQIKYANAKEAADKKAAAAADAVSSRASSCRGGGGVRGGGARRAMSADAGWV